MKPKLTTEQLLSALPRADSRDYIVNLVDHRGRRFIHSFFVSSDHSAPGWFVGGISSSGATQIVARPKVARRKNTSGARVHAGWRQESAAQEIADLLTLHRPPTPGTAARAARTTNCDSEGTCCPLDGDGYPSEEETWLAYPWHLH